MRCTTDKYNDLYAKWLKDPTDFINFANLKPSDKILDLCGGTGQLSLKLLEMGFEDVTLLDLNPRINDGRITIIQSDINKTNLEILEKYDVIFCRQAISYLQ
jgi:ubiquinone/menaquinone biosynthesis C-methylase UbiE